ncbi:hypothetical protein DENIS_0786 [Desulfonema ishimotonii]|uniref:PAC domain-containing protein n=1 Tax=Desulfonema ishimotonii TaxID=45657 RepID=A0A401FSA7_9BACT|nr:hypothetical protein [Desulfonema ishimotonii]GBC59845.1 hypothetical protein DENIS_0786 [Desulfonema ishimotonii]
MADADQSGKCQNPAPGKAGKTVSGRAGQRRNISSTGEGHEVIGKTLEEIESPDDSVLECLSGKTFINIKKSIITPRGRFQFFATGKPIKDASGRVVGAVEIVKDMKEIRALAQAVSQPVHTTFSDVVEK